MKPHPKRVLKKTPPSILILSEIVIGALLSISSFFVFSKIMIDVVSESTITMDIYISEFFYSLRTPELTLLLRTITYFGNEVIIIGTLLMTGLFLWKKYRDEAVMFLAGIGGGYVLNTIIKHIIQRPRPDLAPIYQEILSSFPSGHAMNAFIFYSLLVFLYFHFTRRIISTIGMGIVACLIILLIGLSRIYLGVHYPSDVIAGYVAGFWWVITVLVLYKTLGYMKKLK